ncbi:MAG: translational GTPase TypA, partial [Chloroflexi bacterium]|nr:translational GTPase TypA [Chloroflexota bacterium]
MDTNALERERQMTIMAKNTAVVYKGVKINIIDTPGHADFSGEVERVLNMADGCLLVVDAVDGPMPQTRFVLSQAVQKRLKPIVVINKIDRPFARPVQVANMVQDLFLELATEPEQLDFPILYASAKAGYAVASLEEEPKSMAPLLDAILRHIPPPQGDASGGFQLLVAALDYDSHLGQIAIGRIARGGVAVGDQVARIERDGATTSHKITRVYLFEGLARKEVSHAEAGEIVAIAGLEKAAISDTIACLDQPEPLPAIDIGEPTVQMTFGVNTSPFAGREGRPLTSRQLRERLMRELQTNVSLRVQETESPEVSLVSGRGELHLAILIETIRRENAEIEVSRPEAIIKLVDGQKIEPYEHLILDIPGDAIGLMTENLASRLAQMTDMRGEDNGRVRLEFKLPTRGLIGFRSFFLKATHGDGVMNSIFTGYEPLHGELKKTRTGVMTAAETGIAVTYGLNNAQERGITFVEPGTPVYEGMLVGMHARENDMVVNVCREKKMSNVRSSTSDIAIKLTPATVHSLEDSLDFIADDEVLEVTPRSLRMRKRILSGDGRYRMNRDKARAAS